MSEEPQIIPPARPMRTTTIKGLIPALPERGKIKIGAKGPKRPTRDKKSEWQPPVKLDHFVVTTLERSKDDDNLLRDEEIHERLGDKPTEIPIRLLYDDPELNFPTRYAAYNGRSLWCSGDGELAQRMGQDGRRFELQCPCHLADPAYTPKDNDPPRCKMNGSLSVIIEGASGLGGVWKFRTTSYNSINGIMSSMMFLRSITGGVLSNIPLKLVVQPKRATNPADGSSVLIYFVSLKFSGEMEDLQKIGHKIALDRATTHVSIQNIEHEARRMLALAAPTNAPLPGDEADDVVSEFYPEEYDKDSESPRPTREQFKATESESEQMASEPSRYTVTLVDGELWSSRFAGQTFNRLAEDMNLRARMSGQNGLNAFWEDNKGVLSQLSADGYKDELVELNQEADTLSEKIAKLESETRSATVAQSDSQSGEQMRERPMSLPDKASPGASLSPPVEIPPLERSQAVATKVPPVANPPGGVNPHQPDKPKEVMTHSPSAPNTNIGTNNAAAPVTNAGDEPRYLVKPPTYGPGRGIDWRKTEAAMCEMILSLTADEYRDFRDANKIALAQMGLAWREGIKRVNDALAEKDREFHG